MFYSIEGVVLKRTNVGETDRIITVFSRERGLGRYVVKGARKSKSKLGGHIDVLNIVRLKMVQGKSMDRVTGASMLEGFRACKSSLEVMSRVYIAFDVLRHFAQADHVDAFVYDSLLDLLAICNSWKSEHQQERLDVFLWAFLLRLFWSHGVIPDVRFCSSCRKPLRDLGYEFFSHEQLDGVYCPSCTRSLFAHDHALGQVSLDSLRALHALRTQSFQRLHYLQLSTEIHHRVGQFIRQLVDYHIQKKLISFEVFAPLSAT